MTPTAPIDTTLHANGAIHPYRDTGGRGAPVLLLHGALADHTMWHDHAARLAPCWRVVMPTLRYHGAAPWQSAWPAFGARLHADDLAAFITALGAGPVHLVAWSYGAHVALTVACEHPALVRSLSLYEPGMPTFVTDAQALAEFGADAQAMFGPVFEAAAQGDLALAVERLIDGSGGEAGYFRRQPEAVRALELAHARTVPGLLNAPPPPALSVADLQAIKVPAQVAWGARSRPVFTTVSHAAAAAIGGEVHREVPGANHMWPLEAPADFVAHLAPWLHGQETPQ